MDVRPWIDLQPIPDHAAKLIQIKSNEGWTAQFAPEAEDFAAVTPPTAAVKHDAREHATTQAEQTAGQPSELQESSEAHLAEVQLSLHADSVQGVTPVQRRQKHGEKRDIQEPLEEATPLQSPLMLSQPRSNWALKRRRSVSDGSGRASPADTIPQEALGNDLRLSVSSHDNDDPGSSQPRNIEASIPEREGVDGMEQPQSLLRREQLSPQQQSPQQALHPLAPLPWLDEYDGSGPSASLFPVDPAPFSLGAFADRQPATQAFSPDSPVPTKVPSDDIGTIDLLRAW
eukprot:CAMPEP_0206136368 /NCGR_PEP_ID=MMETSP1473-20131121/1601_1 /ASSEMBLY_ACC=CAM_ASM_001109 /TAXON_ID=1461547 /ORGANISM="Stichococcus sp, Strain RCC1054" /LENGTH=286 /DNA_ID=CAMNT_0053528845 /DNA_START=102 /DNA_END=959 /DNA_ORIENTATION=+